MDKAPDTDTKSDEELDFAVRALDAGETGFEQAAVKVSGHGTIPASLPKSILALESLFPHGLDGFVVGFEELE